MNGFASSILTLLLSWMRSFINNFWLLLTSERGGSFLAFFRAHWKTLFLLLCVGGFLLDFVIYLIRWRPHYVWGTRLDRIRRKHRNEPNDWREQDASFYPQRVPVPPPPPRQMPPQEDFPSELPPLPVMDAPYGSAADSYARQDMLSYYASTPNPYAQPLSTPFDSPVFTADSPTRVSPQDSFFPAEPFDNPGENLNPAFGASRPEPAQYLHDIQAGFAPPLPPQELYPPYAAAQSDPVHPGLDLETFQQNVGLSAPDTPAQDTSFQDSSPYPSAEAVPGANWVSFQPTESEEAVPPRGSLSQFFQKARNLVSIRDEDNPPTIRDLQSSVDMRKAFHRPVFPHGDSQEGGDNE